MSGSKWWRSGENARLPPIWSEFKSRRRPHMWAKFQFDQESGRSRTTLWMRYLQIIIHLQARIQDFEMGGEFL